MSDEEFEIRLIAQNHAVAESLRPELATSLAYIETQDARKRDLLDSELKILVKIYADSLVEARNAGQAIIDYVNRS